MQRKNKVLIKINGQEYPIMGAESKEYLLKVGNYVDEKMEEVAAGNKRLSTSMIAVLTSINIADQYLKLKDAYEKLQGQQEAPLNELQKVKDEHEKLLQLLALKEASIHSLETEKEKLGTYKANQQEIEEMKKMLNQKSEDLKKAEEMINDLQNKLFESQIKLVETRRQMEELLDYSVGDVAGSEE